VHIRGERRFDAAQDDVFRALTDADEMASAFSAIELVEAHGPHWTLKVKAPLPGGLRLTLTVDVEELREPEHARLRAWSKGFGGRISVNSFFDLAPDGSGTLMRWSAEINAAGLLSGLGRQELAPVATHQAERALDRIAGHLETAAADRRA
jgi:carbon monoxide dehydrogenase subunit G